MTIKKVLALLLALILIVGLIPTVATATEAENDPIAANATVIKLQEVESAKKGLNLDWAFVSMSRTTDAPAGYNGESVYTATSGHIGGSNGGVCTTVDLTSYDFTGKSVYLRYYIPAYAGSNPNWQLAANTRTDGNTDATGTGGGYTPYANVVYDEWTYIDITQGLDAIKRNLFSTDIALVYWAGISEGSEATCTVYVDGLYVVETDPIAANGTVIKLGAVESDKKGLNLDWAFAPMEEAFSAPFGYNGESVHAATSGHIGGSNGGVCTTVDLTSYNFTGKNVYLRYYISSYTGSNPNWQLTVNTRTDGNEAATGTAVGYTPYTNITYNEWTYLDITEGLDAIKRNLFSTDIALVYWAGIGEGSTETCTVYVDGLYVVDIPKGVNLLYNEDFEKAGWAYNRDDWSNNPDIAGGRFDWSATGGVDNSAAWVGTPGTNANQNAALWLRPADKLVTLDAGCRYIVSAKVYRENTDAVVYIGPRIDDSWMIGESSGTTKTGEWETINMVFEMSETKAVNIMVRALNYTTGTVKIDDVSLCQLDVEKAFDIIKFNGATITGISDTYVTTQLTFGAKVWINSGSVLLCEKPATITCGDGTNNGYQYGTPTAEPGKDVEYVDERPYASTWTVKFDISDCKANHLHFGSLWGNGKPDSCVVRITDWFGEGQSNYAQVDRMVLDSKAAIGINGQMVAAEYHDVGMDYAWVDAQELSDVTGEFALQADVTTNVLTVPSDAVLDLNGYTVTAENLVSYGNIVDSSKGEALIKVSGHKEIRRDNSAMALYDAGAGGYRFFDYTTESLKKDVDDSTKKFGVRMLFNEAKAYELLAATDNADTAVKMFIDIDGTTYEYTFNSAILTEYAQKAGAKLGVASDTKVTLVLTITGYEKVVGKTVTVSGAYGSTTGVASDLVY